MSGDGKMDITSWLHLLARFDKIKCATLNVAQQTTTTTIGEGRVLERYCFCVRFPIQSVNAFIHLAPWNSNTLWDTNGTRCKQADRTCIWVAAGPGARIRTIQQHRTMQKSANKNKIDNVRIKANNDDGDRIEWESNGNQVPIIWFAYQSNRICSTSLPSLPSSDAVVEDGKML